jgi:hypothetical protein
MRLEICLLCGCPKCCINNRRPFQNQPLPIEEIEVPRKYLFRVNDISCQLQISVKRFFLLLCQFHGSFKKLCHKQLKLTLMANQADLVECQFPGFAPEKNRFARLQFSEASHNPANISARKRWIFHSQDEIVSRAITREKVMQSSATI